MKNRIKYLPTKPGCYLFKDKNNVVIYVGKAKNIRKRVSSYFQKRDHDAKTSMLVSEIRDLDTIVTTSESEAFLLESNLIKKYSPKYNLDLKDSYRYAYIQIKKGEFPWIEIARVRSEKDGEYYGPFVSGKIRKTVVDIISRNFKIFLKKPSSRFKKLIDKKEYTERVNQARMILSGRVDELITYLREKMKVASDKNYFEYAITLKSQIEALETLKEKQIVELTEAIDLNIINYLVLGDEVYLIVFSFRKGVLEEKVSYSFDYYGSFFEDFLLQYYDFAPIPSEIVLPKKVEGVLEKYLSEKKGRNVKIIYPVKGEKKDLLELAYQNILTTFFASDQRVLELKKILALEKAPKHIECFDVSHLGGTGTTGSMVTFIDGLPEKKLYRKFKISEDKNDDYLAMREVISRRYGGSLSKKMAYPDLIVVDGGPGQLAAAKLSLEHLNIKLPVISLAKKFEEIYNGKDREPLVVSRKNKGLQLLQALRDEAHRFAVSYQRSLRSLSKD